MDKQEWHPGRLLEVSGFYWKTCALHAAVKLDLFTTIGDGAFTGKALAEKLDADRDGTTRLLNALAAMGLVEKKDDRFVNIPAGKKFLSSTSDSYLGFMILHHHYLVASWSRLDEAVRTGTPVRTRASFEDHSRREAFLMGMFNNAMLQAPALVEEMDLTGCASLLDMGGGPGTYAIHFCRRHPALSATVYDLPTTRPFAEKTIARFGLRDRIAFVDGDYTKDPVPGRYDAVWMSHILHGEGPDTCRQMVQKAADALAPGGRIMIHDFILDSSAAAPLFAALFSLNMLLGTGQGRSYSEPEIFQMLEAAGINDIRRAAYQGPTQSGVITGRKK